MSNKLKGTNLSSPIVPFTTDDEYPTHYSKYGKGGYMSVDTLSDMYAIPQLRREEGMLVYCSQNKLFYQLKTESTGEQVWVETTIGAASSLILGTQMYDEDKVAQLEELGILPDKYVSIPSEPYLSLPQVQNSYLNIIFSSLRTLQAEVAKLRNSFRYGMYSYTNRETAMSSVVGGYDDVEDTEPLWSVDESDCSLSMLTGATVQINDNHTLVPKENVSSAQGILSINQEGAYWFDGEEGYEDCEDTKLYLYLTTSNTNIVVTLKNVEYPEDQSKDITIDFGKLDITKSRSEKYNIMVCVSRAVVNDEDVGFVGKNYVWISVGNYGTGETTNSGFWKDDELFQRTTIIGDSENLSEYRYFIYSVYFRNEDLYKFNGYSQFQNFTESVESTTPDDTDYKYRVAHITIRSVENLDMLNSIKSQLPTNELIYNEANGTLWIKLSNGTVRQISGNNTEHSGMEQAEIIEWLEKNGIHVTESGTENIRIDNLSEITFIHQGTGKSFKFMPDSEGNLKGMEIPQTTLSKRMIDVNFSLPADNSPVNSRGFVGELGYEELHNRVQSTDKTKDLKLYSDRIKIGAVYAPYSSEQSSYGCSHGFIELENTSDMDFQLEGCFLHFATGVCTSTEGGVDDISVFTLPLDGVIPSGGTYLVRCKQYAEFGQANVFVNVDSFDKEWYNGGSLLDLTLSQNNSFLLTYGIPDGFSFTKTMVISEGSDGRPTNFPWLYHPRYIDSVTIGEHITTKGSAAPTWTATAMKKFTKGAASNPIDCIYKNTFMLDPAKQAYQSLSGADSSRKRNENVQDYQYVLLNKDVIEFPKTIPTVPVSVYTPKASYQHKNVSTDKTKLDVMKPNMVTCSFGIDIYRTRCFNWISCGVFDEYIWLREVGASTWAARFESYKNGTENDSPDGLVFSKKKFGKFHSRTSNKDERIQDVVYSRIIGMFPGDGTRYTSHKCIVDIDYNPSASGATPKTYEYVVGRADKNGNPDIEHVSEVQDFTLYPTTYAPRIFQITDQQGFHWIEYQVWAAAAEKLLETINDKIESEHVIPIIINTGDMTQNGTRINEWLDYYNGGICLFKHFEQMNVVGNNDLCGPDPEVLGTGDDNGKSNAFYFHVFYCYEISPMTVSVTEETSGSIEVTEAPSPENAVAGQIYKVVDNETATYYKADCILPLISNSEATEYIPSLYYFDTDTHRIVMVNSELTPVTCEKWFKQKKGSDVVNVYTGWPMTNGASTDSYDTTFTGVYTTVYTKIYDMINTTPLGNKVIAVMHEMPFTVVTNANLSIGSKNLENVDRSLNGSSTGSLVGSHMNRMSYSDTHALYWFSRLMEHFGVKLCLGGHKHTYACTNPLREFYYYTENNASKNSLTDGKMTMSRTLENDSSTWTTTLYETSSGSGIYTINAVQDANTKTVNTSKFPLMNANAAGVEFATGVFYPYYGVASQQLADTVTYFMCQATGYKLKSNKELPSTAQMFSYVIPETNVGTSSDKPSEKQLDPMFAEVVYDKDGNNVYHYTVYLRKIMNIFKIDSKNTHQLFSQLAYSTQPMSYQYLVHEAETGKSIIFGKWVVSESPRSLISLQA